MKQVTINGKTLMFVEVPHNAHDIEIRWSNADSRFSIYYKFSRNHTGAFIMWYKDFGGRKHYPKRNEVQFLCLYTATTEEIILEVLQLQFCDLCTLEKKGVYGVTGGFVAGCEGSQCDATREAIFITWNEIIDELALDENKNYAILIKEK